MPTHRSTLPKIYYFTPISHEPTGGIQKIYEHVDILNANGFSAQVVHEYRWPFKKPRYSWCHYKTPIKYVRNLAQLKLDHGDFLVLPELLGPNMADLHHTKNKVIFNQNAYYSFRGGYNFIKTNTKTAYRDPSVKAVITVSEDSQNYLKYIFPHLQIHRVHLSIDKNCFYFSAQKKKQIALMPRKSRADLLQVINILKMRNTLQDFDIITIDHCSRSQVSSILRESLIFLSSGTPEGFQLPAAEALTCGCIVIGYHGQAAKEFLKPDFSYPIEVGCIINFAKTLETIIKEYNENSHRLDMQRKQGADFIARCYHQEIEARELTEIWRTILTANGCCG